MRCTNVLRVPSIEGVQRDFNKALAAIWQRSGHYGRLGLAISGGVDSMALASLCSQFAKCSNVPPSFTAFIVDHGLRKGSSQEAVDVAAELRALRIEPCILNLNWGNHADPSQLPNLETVARKLRYQALGRACYQHGVQSLLVAHHADDQAETVLLRLLGRYMGLGLQGIRPLARIPECQGIYGVDASGRPQNVLDSSSNPILTNPTMVVERGGVTISRPLLPFTKEQLIEICRQSGTKWFEDHTNSDRTLTRRNTVRFLQNAALFPIALQRERMLALADTIRRNSEEIDVQAQELLDCMCINLDLRVGSVTCSFGDVLCARIKSHHQKATLQAAMLRKLVRLVSPRADIPLQAVNDVAEMAFNSDWNRMRQQVAGVAINGNRTADQITFVIHREAPYSKVAQTGSVEFGFPDSGRCRGRSTTWSEWSLWDSRFWIRVAKLRPTPIEDVRISARFLTSRDIGLIRISLNDMLRTMFDNIIAEIPAKVRLTLPVLVARKGDVEEVVALPSIGWSRSRWRCWCPSTDPALDPRLEGVWEIRYRSTEWETGSTRD